MFACYLDRFNVGFAALTMNKDLGFGAYLFGLGAGAFYGGYCLFEAPSNLMLDYRGAGAAPQGCAWRARTHAGGVSRSYCLRGPGWRLKRPGWETAYRGG
jgi:hypothetical protein